METNRNLNKQPASNKLVNMASRLSLLNPLFLWGVVVVVAGIFTGLILSNLGRSGFGFGGGKIEVAPGAKITDGEVGITDERTFRDDAEGKLEKGGIDGEGSHHLVRPGGDSQNVYLTSSVISLEDFVGKKVHIWGETHKGQKAGWLMDVGKIRIIE